MQDLLVEYLNYAKDGGNNFFSNVVKIFVVVIFFLHHQFPELLIIALFTKI